MIIYKHSWEFVISVAGYEIISWSLISSLAECRETSTENRKAQCVPGIKLHFNSLEHFILWFNLNFSELGVCIFSRLSLPTMHIDYTLSSESDFDRLQMSPDPVRQILMNGRNIEPRWTQSEHHMRGSHSPGQHLAWVYNSVRYELAKCIKLNTYLFCLLPTLLLNKKRLCIKYSENMWFHFIVIIHSPRIILDFTLQVGNNTSGG